MAENLHLQLQEPKWELPEDPGFGQSAGVPALWCMGWLVEETRELSHTHLLTPLVGTNTSALRASLWLQLTGFPGLSDALAALTGDEMTGWPGREVGRWGLNTGLGHKLHISFLEGRLQGGWCQGWPGFRASCLAPELATGMPGVCEAESG